jgi:hypothetical protein
MIKIKLTNWNKGRNSHTFRPFLMYSHYFNDIGVQFIDDGSYDIEFIGMHDFINRKLTLNDSIEYGITNLQNKSGDYCLFDGSDSTSLLGSYEVFLQSNAKYLFKTALTSREQYATPSAFNKWFFGNGSDIDIAYNIPQSVYDNIRLTGWNHGYHNPSYLIFDTSTIDRDIDVCAIYQGQHIENTDHCVRNDIYYTNHRLSPWEILNKLNGISYEINKRPYEEFVNILRRSKCTLSPYGMGEICFRDFEIIQYGSVMIKPDMSLINTYPNIYIPYETYIPCKLDWSDLEEKIDWVKSHPKECKDIINNSRELMKKTFTIENLLLYWHNVLLTFNTITI